KLAKQFKKDHDVNITLIDSNPFHTLMTELHEVAGHRVEPDSVRVPFSKIFGASKVKVVNDTITDIDFTTSTLKSRIREYKYDYLVLGTGAEPEFYGIPGIKENAFTLWSFDDAMKLRYHIDNVFEKAVAEPDRLRRESMLTFVVAGSGFTGIEMAGELLEWRDAMCAKWLVAKNEVRVCVVEAMPNILPMFEEDLRDKISYYMKQHGIELLTNTPIVGADKGVIKLKDGSTLSTDTFIWTCGICGSNFAESLNLAKGPFGKEAAETKKKNKKGRLLVTEEIRSVDYPNVFPVGDTCWFVDKDQPLPQIVETALITGRTAASNIIAAIVGTPTVKFKPDYHGLMVSVGSRYGVSNAMGIKLSGFFAMFMKHFVNLHYLISVAGLNQCWEYLKHEFLDRNDHRTFLFGFGTYRNRGYWALPLRLWLGLMWVFEGINKIGEGWLSWGSGSKSAWMFSQGVVQAGLTDAATSASTVVEAATSASTAAASAAPAAVDDLFGSFSAGGADAFSSASTAVADTVSSASTGASDAVSAASGAAVSAFHDVWDTTKSIFNVNGSVATWFRTIFMDGIASHIHFGLFQLIIVLVEMGIGLMMIGGLFTWWAAVISIIMCLVFTISGMFAWNQVWFIFAGFLLLGGAGRAFGLDCWVVPFFKKWWNGTRFARKRYWYTDGPSK
ncbi:MAG: FAD-dependent oxidoreductase, partial [Treponema sp.]|nr:FAD-dependent oxidoreductase [Treponema sp.]